MPKYRKRGVRGITANGHRRRHRDRRVRSDHAGRHQPAERSGDSRALRQQVGLAVERARGVRQVRRCRNSAREFSWTAEEAERGKTVERVRRRVDDEPARGDRPRLGPGRSAAAGRIPTSRSEEHYSAIEEARADLVALFFLPDPKLVEVGLIPEEHHDDIVRAGYEGYTRNVARAAAPCAPGIADRRRSHAKPPADRPLDHGAHHRDRTAQPRRQDLLRHDRPARVPRGCRPAAGRDPADQGRRGLRRRQGRSSKPTASISIRPCATKWSPGSTVSVCRRIPASSCRDSKLSGTTPARSST